MDKREKFWTMLTDFSKAFDCIDHERLIMKLF